MSAVTWTIGCVEDDPDQAALLRLWLEQAGYGCAVFRSASDFRRRLGNEAVDLVLLDRSLPDAKGLDVLAWIRQSPNSRLPVIFLTASGQESDIIVGLAAGADAYVVKPPKQGELLARVAAVLRRRGGDAEAGDVLDLPPYRIDAQRRVISVNGEPVELTQREFELACYLFRRQGRIVSRDALLENVWNLASDVSTRTVDTHISRLRKKLGLSGENGWRLTAVYQHGYRIEQGEPGLSRDAGGIPRRRRGAQARARTPEAKRSERARRTRPRRVRVASAQRGAGPAVAAWTPAVNCSRVNFAVAPQR